jgi:hypothetical protein
MCTVFLDAFEAADVVACTCNADGSFMHAMLAVLAAATSSMSIHACVCVSVCVPVLLTIILFLSLNVADTGCFCIVLSDVAFAAIHDPLIPSPT